MQKDGLPAMNQRNGFEKNIKSFVPHEVFEARSFHPAWREFMRYCAELKHGEIEVLKIQDGLPMLAEAVKKKVKFAP